MQELSIAVPVMGDFLPNKTCGSLNKSNIFGESLFLGSSSFLETQPLNTQVGQFQLALRQYQPSGKGGTRSPPATPHRLQRGTTCKIQNGRQGGQKWPKGSGKVFTPRFLGILSNFR